MCWYFLYASTSCNDEFIQKCKKDSCRKIAKPTRGTDEVGNPDDKNNNAESKHLDAKKGFEPVREMHKKDAAQKVGPAFQNRSDQGRQMEKAKLYNMLT